MRLVPACVLLALASGQELDFPSIQTLARSQADSFAIPQPSLDLEPTSLAASAPMIMGLPELQSNLEETEFAKNFPMDFSITQPKLDLVPSFAIIDEKGEDIVKESTKEEDEEEEEEDTSAVIEVVEEGHKKSKREASSSSFPTFFSLMISDTDHFPIAFPTPDLHPRLPDPLAEKAARSVTEKRQVQQFTFNDVAQFLRPARRPARQGRQQQRPVYPPFNPFDTHYGESYLGGPSSPHYALRLQGDNPHLRGGARAVSFRRPIRQSRNLRPGVLPKMFQDSVFKTDTAPVADPFRYKSSDDFDESSLFKSFLFNLP